MPASLRRELEFGQQLESAVMADELTKRALGGSQIATPGVPRRAFEARPSSKRRASGGRPRHDRRLCRRLWHDHLWRLRVVHERQHHPDRLSGRGRPVRPTRALRPGDPLLRHRFVRRNPHRAVRGPLCAAGRVRRGRSRTCHDHRLHRASFAVRRRRDRGHKFRDGNHEQRVLSHRRAVREIPPS